MENNNLNKASNYLLESQLMSSNLLNNINTLDKFNIIHYYGQIMPRIFLNLNEFHSFYESKKENIVIDLKENDISKTELNDKINIPKIELSNDFIKKEENKKIFFKYDTTCNYNQTNNYLNNLQDHIENIKNSIKGNNFEINNSSKNNNQNQMLKQNTSTNENINTKNKIIDINISNESSKIKEYVNNINVDSNDISAIKEKENDSIFSNNINSFTKSRTDKIVFVVEMIKPNENNEKHMNFFVSKKRGRKNKSNKKIHSGFDDDNIQRKIQVHYISFITNFINDIILTFNKSERVLLFKNIDYKLKKVVSQEFFQKLKTLKVSDIIQMRPSPKMKIHHDHVNQEIYKEICSIIPFMKEFLDQNYISLFKKYYCNKDKDFIINGKKIILSEKTKTFSDLLLKNKTHKEKLLFVGKYYFLNEDTKQNV